MPDLPETGLRAVLENADGFEKDAKKLEAADLQLAAAEDAAAEASARMASAMETNSASLAAAGAQAGEAAAQVAAAGDALDQAITPETAERLRAAFAAIDEVSPEIGDAFRELGADLVETEQDAAMLAAGMEAAMEGAGFAVGKLAAQYDDFLQGISDTSALGRTERVFRVLGTQSMELEQDLRQQQKEWLDAGKSAEEWADAVEDRFGDTVRQIEQGTGRIGIAADEAGNALQAMVAILSFGAVQQFAATAGRVGDQIIGLAKDVTLTAARIEELDLVLGNLAEQNDLSAQSLRDAVEAIRAQGIQADVAYNLVSQFVRANLDLSKASDLARLAQDAAVISMEDSSQALAGILHGILTLQPEVLRYRGLIVDLESEYKRWSDTTGQSTLSLTGAEKQQIALNAALAQGATITGTYESAMTSASKQLRSFPRYINDLKAELGESLLPAYSDVIFATKDLFKEISALPEPIKATTAVTGTFAGAMLKGTSAAVGFGAQIGQIIPLITQLRGTTLGASLAFLGPLGLVAGLAAVIGVGAITYFKAQEEAHRDEAAAILANAETYYDYIRRLEDAGLEAYKFTESLYDLAKAKRETDAAFDTSAFQEALEDLEALGRLAPSQFQEGIPLFIQGLSDLGVAIAQDRDQMERLAEQIGYTGELRDLFVDQVIAAAQAEEYARTVSEQSTESLMGAEERWLEERARLEASYSRLEDYGLRWIDSMRAQNEETTSASDAARQFQIDVIEMAGAMDEMARAALNADPAVAKLTEELVKLLEKGGEAEAFAYTFDQLAEIANDAEEEIREIRADAQADQEKAYSDHLKDLSDLDEDYADRREDIYDDIAKVNADLLEDLAKQEADYQEKRAELVAEGAQAIIDAERELTEARAQVQADLERAIAEAEAGHAAAVVAAREALGEALAELETRHAENQKEIWDAYYEALEELEQSHADRRVAIEERAQQRLERLEQEHGQRQKDIVNRYLAEVFKERYGHLNLTLRQQEYYFKQLQAAYARGENVGLGVREDDLRFELEKLQEARDEQADLIDQAKTEELAAEDEAHAERLKLLEERRDEELEKEKEAYEKTRAERQRQYDERLKELAEALDREKEEARRKAEERRVELAAEYEKELADLRQANADRLAELEGQRQDEINRLNEQAQDRRNALAEQLQDARDSYDERKTDLETALADEQTVIATEMQKQVDEVEAKAKEQQDAFVNAWKGIDPLIGEAIDTTLTNTIRPKLTAIGTEIEAQVAAWIARIQSTGFVGQSPAPFWEDMGQSWVEGLRKGAGGLDRVMDDQLAEMGKFKLGAENLFQVGSPSKWAEGIGESVTAGFDSKAVLAPKLEGLDVPEAGQMALEAFLSGEPSVEGQDLALTPYLTGVPEVPAQRMAIDPYLLDVPALEVQPQVRGEIPAAMAAAGAGQQTNVTNSREFSLNYTGAPQEEPSLRALITMLEMRAGNG